MFEEIIKYINKPVTLLLKNGKEKTGRVVFVDSDDQTITFEDESTLVISFIKSIRQEDTTPLPPNDVEVLASLESKVPIEISSKLEEIKLFFQEHISSSELVLKTPELHGLPQEIKSIDGLGKSDEAKMWTNILNQYNDGIRLGKFSTDMDKVERLIAHVNHLANSPYLQSFVLIPQLLGYLHFVRGNKKEALEYIKQAIKLEDTPKNWIMLATMALEAGEQELAFFTLKKLFFKVNFTEEVYQIVWFKFLELIIKIPAYNDFLMIFGSKYRQFTEKEKQGIFEAVVYFLIKHHQRKDAEALLLASQNTAQDLKLLALEALKNLGKPDREYDVPEIMPEEPALPKKEIIDLPPSTRSKAKITDNNSNMLAQYTFTSVIVSLRENYGFIKYGSHNLFFHYLDLANCTFAELSEGVQVEFKLKKGIKGTDVACEIKLITQAQ